MTEEKSKRKFKDNFNGPLMAAILVIIIFVYIISNEISIAGGIKNVPSELWIVLAPGLVIIASLLIMARGRKTPKAPSEISTEVKINKI